MTARRFFSTCTLIACLTVHIWFPAGVLAQDDSQEIPTPQDLPSYHSCPVDPCPVSMRVLKERFVHYVTPTYPPFAEKSGIEGTAILWIVVNTEGEVESVRRKGGDFILLSAAEEAARQWLFAPATRRGEPVRTNTIVIVSFERVDGRPRVQITHSESSFRRLRPSRYLLAVHLEPENADAQAMLGRALSVNGYPEAAIDAYREALRLDPRHPEAHADLSSLLTKQKKWDVSLDASLAWVRAFPDQHEPYSSLAGKLAYLGGLDWNKPPFREALGQVPDPIRLRLQVAYTLSQEGLGGAAYEQYQQVLQLDPGNERARKGLQRFSRERVVGKRSVEVLWAWLLEHPQDSAARQLLIFMLFNGLNDYDGAIAILHETIQLDPASVAPYRRLAYILQRRLGFGGAAHELEASVVAKYENAPAYLVLAETLHRQGDDGAALLAAQEALQRNKHSTETYDRLARLLTKLGDPYGADRARTKAKALGPRPPSVGTPEFDPELKRVLEAIDQETKHPADP